MRNKILLVILTSLSINGCGQSHIESNKSFGVFLGTNDSYIDKLKDYQNVAIEIEEFGSLSIKILKDYNTGIYAYLSVGSLESYRSYYDEFKQYTFQDYENWEEERWIDASITSWQDKIVELANSFKKAGADGLFLDNFDVYYYAKEVSAEFGEKNYQGCHQILDKLSKLDLKLLVNSGTDFLERLGEENDPLIDKIDWYAQECVFSNIKDYKNNRFGRQNKEDQKYYQSIVNIMKNHSNVLLIEYTKNKLLINKIKTYCGNNNFHYYITDHINLD